MFQQYENKLKNTIDMIYKLKLINKTNLSITKYKVINILF